MIKIEQMPNRVYVLCREVIEKILNLAYTVNKVVKQIFLSLTLTPINNVLTITKELSETISTLGYTVGIVAYSILFSWKKEGPSKDAFISERTNQVPIYEENINDQSLRFQDDQNTSLEKQVDVLKAPPCDLLLATPKQPELILENKENVLETLDLTNHPTPSVENGSILELRNEKCITITESQNKSHKRKIEPQKWKPLFSPNWKLPFYLKS